MGEELSVMPIPQNRFFIDSRSVNNISTATFSSSKSRGRRGCPALCHLNRRTSRAGHYLTSVWHLVIRSNLSPCYFSSARATCTCFYVIFWYTWSQYRVSISFQMMEKVTLDLSSVFGGLDSDIYDARNVYCPGLIVQVGRKSQSQLGARGEM